jgi:hypothetical protein
MTKEDVVVMVRCAREVRAIGLRPYGGVARRCGNMCVLHGGSTGKCMNVEGLRVG